MLDPGYSSQRYRELIVHLKGQVGVPNTPCASPHPHTSPTRPKGLSILTRLMMHGLPRATVLYRIASHSALCKLTVRTQTYTSDGL